jgi:O-antigen ligase
MHILLFLLPLTLLTGVWHPAHTPPVYFIDVACLIIALVALWRGGWQNARKLWDGFPPLLKSLLLLICGGFITGFVRAVSLSEAANAFKSWFVLPFGAILSVLAYWHAKPSNLKKDVAWLQWGIITFALVQTCVGLVWLGMHHYAENRLAGFFLSPNAYAAAVVPAFFMALQQALREKKYMAWLAVLLIALGIVLSHSLGGVGALIGGLALLVLQIQNPRYRGILVGVLFLGLLFLGVSAYGRFNKPGQGTSWDSRRQIWHSAATLINDYPIAGVGLRSFDNYYAVRVVELYPHPFEVVEPVVPEAHNLYLALWLNLGFLGGLGMIVLVGYLIKAQWAIGHAAFWYAYPLIALLIHGLVDTPFFWLELSVMWWLCILISLSQVAVHSVRKNQNNLE